MIVRSPAIIRFLISHRKNTRTGKRSALRYLVQACRVGRIRMTSMSDAVSTLARPECGCVYNSIICNQAIIAMAGVATVNGYITLKE